ncbi:phosphoribosyl pyrophosphate synthase-associated protein 2-like isoform X4 [Ascaphus truei]|uniref:phosphoribosyl pyrophosphate synthase-associated protein 2-like isoform X4 n=1 Tax=Ascaphus truei TaxID=8439 RepID=UPI003F59E68C
MNITKGGLVLFSANSNASCMELAKKMAERLGVELGKVLVYQETNRETRVQIQESVRGKDVFIIQTVSKDVNTTIMELLIMVYACRTSCAKTISGVIPYFPYSKQCKMRKRGSIVSKLLASMMCKAGKAEAFAVTWTQTEKAVSAAENEIPTQRSNADAANVVATRIALQRDIHGAPAGDAALNPPHGGEGGRGFPVCIRGLEYRWLHLYRGLCMTLCWLHQWNNTDAKTFGEPIKEKIDEMGFYFQI